MCDEWMPLIKQEMTIADFHRLPRNAAYKYEYLGGQAWLSPRPKHYHAVLELRPAEVLLETEPVSEEHFAELPIVLASAFRFLQPFGSLEHDARLEVARSVLERTRTGGDGPWLPEASFAIRAHGRLAGAILITVLPEGEPDECESWYWREPPPQQGLQPGAGRAHLTWIFVAGPFAAQGLGTALLARAGNALLERGHSRLYSTFMLGNDSSLLWHWRRGFQLLEYPWSHRRTNERVPDALDQLAAKDAKEGSQG